MFEFKKVHIIGVAGTLMGAFASFLKRSGIEVTGSDHNVYPPMSDILAQAGIKVFSGYSAENLKALNGRPDMVVIGNVIPASNPEAIAVAQGDYPYCSLPEFMEKYILDKTQNLVVCGTHGKTTTSSLLTYVLQASGRSPSFFIGGVSLDIPHSFEIKDQSKYFVLEGDEYDTAYWDKVPKFYHYRPQDVILTSVEYDHADIYPDFESVKKVFRYLVKNIKNDGKLIACLDDPTVEELLVESSVPVLTYGYKNRKARFQVSDLQIKEGETHFSVLDQGSQVSQLRIKLPGAYNALNALAVWIECRELGLSDAEIVRALSQFKGVKRRQEVRAVIRQITVIDDFAHHPTAVRETLMALKQKYRDGRLLVVFEPRSATSRRKVFQKDYVNAFTEADLVSIAMPYNQSKIPEKDQFSSAELVADLTAKGKKAKLMTSTQEGLDWVCAQAKSGDTVAVLSNGGFDGFIEKLIVQLKK